MEKTSLRVARPMGPGKLPFVEPVPVARVGAVEYVADASLFVFVAELPGLLLDGQLDIGDMFGGPISVLQENAMGLWSEVHVLRLWDHRPGGLYERLHGPVAEPVAVAGATGGDDDLPL